MYAKVLAVSNNAKGVLAEISERSKIPVLTRKTDASALKKTALECWEKDVLANELYNLATGENGNENYTLFV